MAAPKFNQKKAEKFLGKYILVGINYLDHTGAVESKKQVHGSIVKVGPEGFMIQLRGTRDGELWRMPPASDYIFPAKPGNYMLKETNETVYNPDFTATFDIQRNKES